LPWAFLWLNEFLLRKFGPLGNAPDAVVVARTSGSSSQFAARRAYVRLAPAIAR
jgi:hypothetical protein